MKIDIESIEISGLGVFAEDQKVVFPKHQVCSITAENQDDGGSNASGKTSFVNSIPINLFGPKAMGVTSEDLKNRHLSVPARTVGHYILDGQRLSIDRTISGKLKIKVGDADWKEGKVDDIQKEINDLIKMTPEQLLMMSHKAQEDTTNFLLMKDSDKKDFLGSFFNLEDYEKAKASADLEVKTAEATLSAINGKIAIVNSQIETISGELVEAEKVAESWRSPAITAKVSALEGQVANLTDAINGLSFILTDAAMVRNSQEYKIARTKYESIVASSNSTTENFIGQLNALGVKRDGILRDIESVQVVIPAELTKSLRDVEQAMVNASAIIDQNKSLGDKINYLQEDLVKRKIHLEHTKRTPVCATCGQNLKDHDPLRHAFPIQKEIDDKTSEIEKLSGVKNRLAVPSYEDLDSMKGLQREIMGKIAQIRSESSKDNLKTELRVIDGQMASIKRELEIITDKSKEAIRDLYRAEQEIISGLKNQIALRSSERENINAEITAVKVQIDMANANVEKIKMKLTAAQTNLGTQELCRTAAESDLKVLEASAYILSKSGFIGYIFDGILEDLNKEINITLKNIPNVRQYSLQFTPDKTAKTTGSVSKNITFVLKDAVGTKNFKPLSGGEKLGIYIAVDESLNTVLSRRLGIQVGWKFLDEQFTWIDSNSKEAILEFYKMRAQNKTYLIVDHASEFNAALDSQIKIIKKDNIARIASGME